MINSRLPSDPSLKKGLPSRTFKRRSGVANTPSSSLSTSPVKARKRRRSRAGLVIRIVRADDLREVTEVSRNPQSQVSELIGKSRNSRYRATTTKLVSQVLQTKRIGIDRVLLGHLRQGRPRLLFGSRAEKRGLGQSERIGLGDEIARSSTSHPTLTNSLPKSRKGSRLRIKSIMNPSGKPTEIPR